MKTIKITINESRFFRFILNGCYVFFLGLLLSACLEEDQYSPVKSSVPVLSTTATAVELKQKEADNKAFTLSWTPGNNNGTNSAIEYMLELDKKGNNFAAPVFFELGKAAYSTDFQVDTYNDLLINSFLLPANEVAELEVRVKAIPADSSVEPQVSNVVTISVTPYAPVFVPDQLYLVGDATPNGWDAGNPTVMTKDNQDPSVFTYQGKLNAGELKFLTVINEWLPSYQRGVDENTLVLRTSFDQPDDKFTIPQTGSYKITVDVIELTYVLEELATAPFAELWIIGDATAVDWDLNNAPALTQHAVDPFIFTYNAYLDAGEFKIATAKSWDAPFYRPLTNHPLLSETSVQLSAGDPDHKWLIEEAGNYKIKLDLRENKIYITPFTPYTTLYIIGDAGPNGWNIDTPSVTMTVDDTNPAIYTYTGALSVGEFKIALGTGDWCGEWIRPLTNYPALTETTFEFNDGCAVDNKWQITEAGTYVVTVDQLNETITIVRQ